MSKFPGALKESEADFNVQEELSEFGFEGLERRSRSLHLVQAKRQEHRDAALYGCKARLDEGHQGQG